MLIIPVVFTIGATLQNVKAESENATLSFQKGGVTENSITVDVVLKTNAHTVKAVTADFSFSPEKLEFQRIESNNKLFSEIVKQEVSSTGIVYLSYYSDKGVKGEIVVASVLFKVLTLEEAKLNFTKNVLALDADTHTNILGDVNSSKITVPSKLSTLPYTGIDNDMFRGIVLVIAVILIFMLTIAGFSTWGGIYFLLGKWEVKGSYKIKKGNSIKAVKKKSQRSKSTTSRKK